MPPKKKSDGKNGNVKDPSQGSIIRRRYRRTNRQIQEDAERGLLTELRRRNASYDPNDEWANLRMLAEVASCINLLPLTSPPPEPPTNPLGPPSPILHTSRLKFVARIVNIKPGPGVPTISTPSSLPAAKATPVPRVIPASRNIQPLRTASVTSNIPSTQVAPVPRNKQRFGTDSESSNIQNIQVAPVGRVVSAPSTSQILKTPSVVSNLPTALVSQAVSGSQVSPMLRTPPTYETSQVSSAVLNSEASPAVSNIPRKHRHIASRDVKGVTPLRRIAAATPSVPSIVPAPVRQAAQFDRTTSNISSDCFAVEPSRVICVRPGRVFPSPNPSSVPTTVIFEEVVDQPTCSNSSAARNIMAAGVPVPVLPADPVISSRSKGQKASPAALNPEAYPAASNIPRKHRDIASIDVRRISPATSSVPSIVAAPVRQAAQFDRTTSNISSDYYAVEPPHFICVRPGRVFPSPNPLSLLTTLIFQEKVDQPTRSTSSATRNVMAAGVPAPVPVLPAGPVTSSRSQGQKESPAASNIPRKHRDIASRDVRRISPATSSAPSVVAASVLQAAQFDRTTSNISSDHYGVEPPRVICVTPVKVLPSPNPSSVPTTVIFQEVVDQPTHSTSSAARNIMAARVPGPVPVLPAGPVTSSRSKGQKESPAALNPEASPAASNIPRNHRDIASRDVRRISPATSSVPSVVAAPVRQAAQLDRTTSNISSDHYGVEPPRVLCVTPVRAFPSPKQSPVPATVLFQEVVDQPTRSNSSAAQNIIATGVPGRVPVLPADPVVSSRSQGQKESPAALNPEASPAASNIPCKHRDIASRDVTRISRATSSVPSVVAAPVRQAAQFDRTTSNISSEYYAVGPPRFIRVRPGIIFPSPNLSSVPTTENVDPPTSSTSSAARNIMAAGVPGPVPVLRADPVVLSRSKGQKVDEETSK